MKTPDITWYLTQIENEKARLAIAESRIAALQKSIYELNTLSKEELIAKSIELKTKLDEARIRREEAYDAAHALASTEVEIEDEYDKVMYQISLFK